MSEAESPMRVAFLGLGRMGLPMAERLLEAGHELHVWNRTPGRDVDLVAQGATAESSPAGATQKAEVVVTMLADPLALDEVVFGPQGVATSIGADAILVDMSTVGPTAIGSVAQRLHPVQVVDAPVLGSVPHAEAGTLTILVGAEETTLARCVPVLAAMGTIQHVGPPGAGATAKLASNAAVMSTMIVLGESLSLTDGLGSDPEVVLDAIGSGPLASFVDRFRGRMTDPVARVDFTLSLARKDLALAVTESVALGLDPAVLRSAIARCDEAIAAGMGDEDNTAIVRHLRSAG